MTTARFPNAVTSVVQARRLVTEELGSVPQEARDAAEMLVSEVVTNVVRHTISDFMVSIDLIEDVVGVWA